MLQSEHLMTEEQLTRMAIHKLIQLIQIAELIPPLKTEEAIILLMIIRRARGKITLLLDGEIIHLTGITAVIIQVLMMVVMVEEIEVMVVGEGTVRRV